MVLRGVRGLMLVLLEGRSFESCVTWLLLEERGYESCCSHRTGAVFVGLQSASGHRFVLWISRVRAGGNVKNLMFSFCRFSERR
jgi:hypothetical protein